VKKTIAIEHFSNEIIDILEETFETHHGVYLDKGTSLFETLDRISAEEASIPVGNQCATIAAQVEHVIFYIEVLRKDITGQEINKPDWSEIWGRVSIVSSEKWNDIKIRLRAEYEKLSVMLRRHDNWKHDDAVGGSIAILVHTAYHLGEIRQALCTIGHSGYIAE